MDKWLPGGRLKDLAPHLFEKIPRRLSGSSLVKDGLHGGLLHDIPCLAIDELMAVADSVEGLTVTKGVVDVFRWNLGAR
jgi:hypothetical protein